MGNKKGFSLAELLLTILIISLAGVTMAGGFTLINNSYKKISQKANGETLLSTSIYKVNSYIRYAEDVSVGESSIKFTDTNTGYVVELTNAKPGLKGLMLNYYSGDKIMQSHQLLSDSTMNDGLTPKIKNVGFEKNNLSFTIEILNRKKQIIASQEVVTNLLNIENTHEDE